MFVQVYVTCKEGDEICVWLALLVHVAFFREAIFKIKEPAV